MEKESYDNNNYSNFQLPIICDADTLQILIREKTVRIVDVRKEQEYQQEHIPTAVSIPLAQLLKKDTPEEIVISCRMLGYPIKCQLLFMMTHLAHWQLELHGLFNMSAIQILHCSK